MQYKLSVSLLFFPASLLLFSGLQLAPSDRTLPITQLRKLLKAPETKRGALRRPFNKSDTGSLYFSRIIFLASENCPACTR